MSESIEFEVQCDCGESLSTSSDYKRGTFIFTVEPCSKCMEKAADKAAQDAREEGYDEGHEDGFQEGCKELPHIDRSEEKA